MSWFLSNLGGELSQMYAKWGVDGNQVEDAQARDAETQEGAQAQRISRSMARALGQECQKMTLLISIE